jgi:metal-dependent amidase/aminoacylase/carboxypeptidase family protein
VRIRLGDPIVTASQIVLGLQTIVSHVNLITESAAVSVGQINAGVRSNVIPEELTMTGTIRSLDGKCKTYMPE